MKSKNDFNLVEEAWVPIAGGQAVSLKELFTNPKLKALGGNPIEKIALTKLSLAIAQSAYTPNDGDEWRKLGIKGLAAQASEYLTKNRKLFWLYGERPFLQMPAAIKAEKQPYCALLPMVASGNTTVLLQSQIPRELENSEKAVLLVTLMSFAAGGKKVDNSVVLSRGYKGKSVTAKPGPSLGFRGYLHNFVEGSSILETLWLNILTKKEIQDLAIFKEGLGLPAWERMPSGEDDQTARAQRQSYLGRLVPLSRFVLLAEDGIHYTEGIFYPDHKKGQWDSSIAIDNSKTAKAIWVDPERRPWRHLTALLSFIEATSNRGFDCAQLRIPILRLLPQRSKPSSISVWSGGLRVSFNAGEQFATGMDDFVESKTTLETAYLSEPWFLRLKQEMAALDTLSNSLFGSVTGYFSTLGSDGSNQAAKAKSEFWTLCESSRHDLIDACGPSDTKDRRFMRGVFANVASRTYDKFCPQGGSRQIEAWAAHRVNTHRYREEIEPTVTTDKAAETD